MPQFVVAAPFCNNGCPICDKNFVKTELPQFVAAFDPAFAHSCNKLNLPNSDIQICPSCNTYFFIVEFCYSYLNFCDIGWGDLTHQVKWLIDHMILWFLKKAIPSLPLGQQPSILAELWVKRFNLQSHVTHESGDHVVFEKYYMSIFTRPITTKIGRIVQKTLFFSTSSRDMVIKLDWVVTWVEETPTSSSLGPSSAK